MIIQDFLLKRRWIILTFSLAAITLATSAYLIYREVYRPKPPNAILSKFGYLFRPQSDMDELNKLIRSQKPVPVTEKYPPSPDTCKLDCPKNPYQQEDQFNAPNNDNITKSFSVYNKTIETDEYIVIDREPKAESLRDDSEEGYVSHGCCRSKQEYKTFDNLIQFGTANKKLHIVTFREKLQYFLTDKCTQDTGCDRGCKCGQQMITAVALVVDFESRLEDMKKHKYKEYNEHVENKARIELVKYPGWCKCFNE